MGFTLMRSKPEYPFECFESVPRLAEPWVLGAKLQAMPPEPLEYRLSPGVTDPLYPMYELPHPLIRVDLLHHLYAAGVDNIQTTRAILHHPTAGVLRDEYVAFNVVGMIATSAFAAEVMKNYVDLEFETDDLEGMESDWSAIPADTRLVRIADRMGRIVVSDDVRRQIELGPDSGLVFFPLTDAGEPTL